MPRLSVVSQLLSHKAGKSIQSKTLRQVRKFDRASGAQVQLPLGRY